MDVACYQEASGKEHLEEVKTSSKVPQSEALLKTGYHLLLSSEQKSEASHMLVMKFVLLVERARLNLEAGLGFLSS